MADGAFKPPRPPLDVAETSLLRARLIATGVIVPAVPRDAPATLAWIDAPTLKLQK